MTEIRRHLINNIHKILSKRHISNNDMGVFLRDIRSLIEFDKQNEKFPKLNFYCTWAAHPFIEKNQLLYTILDKVNVGFNELPISNSESSKIFKNYIDILIDALSLSDLDENINRLLFTYLKFDIRLRKRILLPIFKNIIHKKISYPDELPNVNKKIGATLSKINTIAQQIEKFEKFKDQKLNQSFDYSKPVFIKSIQITKVINNSVVVELNDFDGKSLIGTIIIQ